MTHRRKSFDKSSLRPSTQLAKRNILRNLGIIGNDGKLDEDAIKGYAECLKQLLPPDVLSSLVHAKGHAFWDLVAGISLPLRYTFPSCNCLFGLFELCFEGVVLRVS